MEIRSLRLILLLSLGLSIPVLPVVARAQAADDEEEAEDLETEDEEPRLRAPTLDPIDVSGGDAEVVEEEVVEEEVEEDLEEEIEEEEEEEEVVEDDDVLPSPGAAADRLDVGGNPTVEPWTSPQTVFELHGYMRMRGEFQDQFSLGREGMPGGVGDLPFSLFIPREDIDLVEGGPAGGCGGGAATCTQRALAFANMRLRLEPTIHLSDDVRVRMQIDVFDNLVLGSTPQGYAIDPGGARRFSEFVPLTAFSQTQVPSSAGVNSWTDSIVVRRAWAEVRNRGLGELRFGRMGNHWGLGILANGGAGIDSDWQSDVDRIMAITRLVGFYFFGAWDFASEGFVYEDPVNPRVPFDAVRNDDVDQLTFGIARRSTPEEQEAALQRGDFVLNGGLYFVYRTQNLTSEGTRNPLDPGAPPALARRGFEVYVPDVWVQFLYENLRLEAEATMMIGTIDNVDLQMGMDPTFTAGTHTILNFGVAFEGEYHLLNNQLGIYFNTGYATGDADVEGLSGGGAGPIQTQQVGANPDTNLSAFSFHPNYRIDMIFWRTIMRQFGSAYYFRPGLSYDFIRSSFGQLLGARADVIWSRAAEPVQTWGNQPDIGVEIDVQAYYRSEDGPDLLDGFYASLQYGIFFPLGGLGYLPGQNPGVGGQNAQTIRLILGVQY
ncbi:MAG: TIGR04551 family protein [Myxococcota bacterium]|nr:TIGR04551 family protein [Myxococcota bacterium]